jgi:phospholipid/cholesterol/gamma-HCH transport system substrate-binding protein
METQARHVLVGGFVLAILAAILVAVVWLARVDPGRQAALYDIYFTGSVTGLAEGAPVRYSGVQIGRVDDISLDPANVERVLVRIEVERPDVIKQGAVASLELQGITGYAFVQITGGSRNSPNLEAAQGQRYPVIASTPSQLEKVFQNAPELLDRAVLVADRLAAVLDERNREALSATLQNVQNATAAIGGKGDQFNGILVEGAQAMAELRRTLASLDKLVDGLNSSLVAENGAMEQLNATLRTADTAVQKLAEMSTKLDGIVQENRPAIREFSQRGLGELTQLITETRQMVAGLTRLAGEIERDPARFFFGDRREGYRPR